MQRLQVNQKVRLLHHVPEMDVKCGTEGVVQSIWFPASPVYEVEFQGDGLEQPVHALVEAEYLEKSAQLEWEK